ncbi:MAG TPA: hypothetical protein DEA08_10195, partial [Planctomycetes bacterium]|nr:hypothetical protein [Planctomycetota bacterium]
MAPPTPSGTRLSDHRRYRTWKRPPGEAVKSSPAFLVAGLLHLVLLVALSFWTIAVHFQQEALPVEVRL